MPLRWDGAAETLPAGYDAALISAVTGHEQAVPADTLCVMAVAVRADRQGTGLGGQALIAMRALTIKAGLERMISPVRPVLESQDPLTPMAGLAFPQTGRYVVPKALDLVDIERAEDLGVYAETNLWMRHL